MPRQPCYWTRKLELDLVDFVRGKEFIWKPVGNTNHHLHLKYRAYAEFAAKLGRGFTARSVRDRWVNIRSTFNNNLRRIEKSKETAKSPSDVYVPCWPLWKPLQFLRDISKRDDTNENKESSIPHNDYDSNLQVKDELQSQFDQTEINIRQRNQRTDRPRRKTTILYEKSQPKKKCQRVIDDLVRAMKPLVDSTPVGVEKEEQSYWFLGRHVTERLNCMREADAECAGREILALLAAVGSESRELT